MLELFSSLASTEYRQLAASDHTCRGATLHGPNAGEGEGSVIRTRQPDKEEREALERADDGH